MENIINQRLASLRDQMRQAGISAVIMPRTDAHLSEYISSHWHIVRYFSGFTGSAGLMVVTLDDARLWVDSRYFLQGEQQIAGTEIKLMKDGLPDTPSYTQWLLSTLAPGSTVGINGLLLSVEDTARLRSDLAGRNMELNVNFDPIDKVWLDRPALPTDKVFVHDVKYAGEEAKSKIGRILAAAKEQGAEAYFTSALDEIAWILNIRSNDVPCNPVATSFLYISPEGSTLWIDDVKLTPEVAAHLEKAGVRTAPYQDVNSDLIRIPKETKVLLDKAKASGAIAEALAGHAVIGSSPVAIPKAVKNAVQIEGIRTAHLRDGVAMVRSLIEIERILKAGEPLTEIGVAEILLENRKKGDLFFDLSFDTIAGFGANGAIVHYTASETSNKKIEGNSLLLIDSGANYLDGTTDLTRTIAIGKPSDDMRHDFTLVMKGHIAIATSVFPEGTRGAQLDAMARLPLWKEGKSYLHGTGHGVGHFLNVHEGPQSIRLNDTMAPLTPGMLTSNEPGVYLEGRYGIRCENLVLTIPSMTTEFGHFYAFETITMCPFDRSLFETSIMSDDEIGWVDAYHATVYEKLAPYLNAEEKEWLKAATAPLNK
ncbi:MAG: aminopeptidase P family protein [Duncaniella sp.]|nr:aminopeptidase P family protein [Duncaniella sp.]